MVSPEKGPQGPAQTDQMTVQVGQGEPVRLFSGTHATIGGSSGRYIAYVGQAWYDPCPPQNVTDYSRESFYFFVVREP